MLDEDVGMCSEKLTSLLLLHIWGVAIFIRFETLLRVGLPNVHRLVYTLPAYTRPSK